MPDDQVSIICADTLQVGLGHLLGEVLRRLQVGFVEKRLEDLPADAVELSTPDCPSRVDADAQPFPWGGGRGRGGLGRCRGMAGTFLDENPIDTEDHAFLDDQGGLFLTGLLLLVMSLILLQNRVIGGGIPLEQDHSFLHEVNTIRRRPRQIQGILTVISRKAHAGSQVFREVVGPQEEGTVLQKLNLLRILQEEVVPQEGLVGMVGDAKHLAATETDHFLDPAYEGGYFFLDYSLTKKKQPSCMAYPCPLCPCTFTSPSMSSHRSSRRTFRQSPYYSSLTCSPRTYPNNPTMNSTLGLRDLTKSYEERLLSRDRRERAFREGTEESRAVVGSDGLSSGGGSKTDGTSFNDFLSFFNLSNLSGSMQTRSVKTSSAAAIKIIAKPPSHPIDHPLVHTPPLDPTSHPFPSSPFSTSCITICPLCNNMTSTYAGRHYVINILQNTNRPTMAKSVQTRESSLEEHSQTKVYYYSKFDLFGQDPQFQQFATFRQRLSHELGPDWAAEAGLLYDPFLSGRQVFLHLLELWLRHHPTVNTMRPMQKASTFNPQFVTEFDSLIRGPSGRIPQGVTVKPAASSLRAVCLGFYMTANQLWEQLFQGQSSNKQSTPFPGGFLKGVTDTLEKTFQPLMVVTQQITSVFGRKRRKLNEDKQDPKDDQSDGEMGLEDCYPCFRKALDMEKQLERKMSDFDLEDLQVQSEQREVHKSSFLEEQSPLQPSIVSHLYSYVTGFLNRNPSWQVASNFVTQILDLNQVQLCEGEKVKVLRPAQDFYRKLVIVWLLCHQDRSSVGFEDYLTALRSSFFAEGWQARFVQPTKYFFEKMRASWEGDREKLSGFISKVQGCVGKDWNAKIATRGC